MEPIKKNKKKKDKKKKNKNLEEQKELAQPEMTGMPEEPEYS